MNKTIFTLLAAALFTAPACAVLYRVGPLYGSITVTDGAGTELSPRTGSPDGTVRYEVEQTDFYSFTVRAPADVTVTVCGAVLTSADASQTGAGVLKGLDSLERMWICYYY